MLLLATFGSGLGTWLAFVALTVDVYDRTHSGPWVSALLIADFLPMIAIGLLFGPLVDRLSRRGLLVAADLARFVVFCALPFATSAGQIVALAAAATTPFPVVSRADVTNVIAYAVLGLLFLWISRTVMKRKARTPAANAGSSQISVSDTDLRQTLDRFLGAADAVDLDAIAAIYTADFLCVRVADEGGFAHLTREQMLSFLKQATSGEAKGHSVPVKNSVIHHAEILGNTALVLITRVKDLGNGWEPLFYSLLWTRQDLTWRLSREFVHQRTVPDWR